MEDIQNYFTIKLVDMSVLSNKKMKGILIPEQDANKEKIGITEQFLADAETYHKKYNNTGYFKSLITSALERISFTKKDPIILDIGSGSGNSIFPCLEIFPDAKIISTDLSPDLLLMIKMHAEQNPSWRERLGYVCMDSCNDYFHHGKFDLVIGSAILHHLIDPNLAILAAKRALRPGGYAIFFEPFENGHAIARLAYTEILKEAQKNHLDKRLQNYFVNYIEHLRVRTGKDKSSDIYRHIDDKWLFTRTYFEEAAKAYGFSSLEIYSLNSLEKPFTKHTETILKLGLDMKPSSLPPWAWEILANYDNAFSPELKQDFLLEGAILYRN